MSGCSGMSIVQVAPGTVIENRHGHKLTVTDENAVHSGGVVYLTATNYDALKSHPSVESKP